MPAPALRTRDTLLDDTYFERKALELVVADDEIEAWELDSQDLSDLDVSADDFDFKTLG
jgi:hypothetical protein